MKSLGKHKRTARGFRLVEFTDYNGTKCSLQASSLALYQQPGVSAIWIGPDDPNPRILARDAAAHGVTTNETCGWVPYPMPEAVSCDTRAHLDHKQVKALIAHLQAWLDLGKFNIPAKRRKKGRK